MNLIGFEKLLFLISLIAFGHSMCVPIPLNVSIGNLYPWWAKTYQLYSVQTHEFIFLIYFLIYSKDKIIKLWFCNSEYGRNSILALFYLSLWCTIPSLFGEQPVKDIFRGGRLFLNGLIYLAIFDFTSNGSNLAIKSTIAGMVIGTIANLKMSQLYSDTNELTSLSGQNTPGVAMGIGIHLCAWCYYSEKRMLNKLIVLGFTSILIEGCSLSYSRVGWISGFMGLIALGVIMLKSRGFMTLNIIIVLGWMAYSTMYGNLSDKIDRFESLLVKKGSQFGDGDKIRLAYFKISAEIAALYPLGVGYSGYYNAQLDIAPNVEGANREDDPTEANPHSSFLWYLVSGGIIGGGLSVYLFVNLLLIIYSSWIRIAGGVGVILTILAIISYTTIALTVPYIFNSMILLLPTAYIRGLVCKKDINGSLVV